MIKLFHPTIPGVTRLVPEAHSTGFTEQGWTLEEPTWPNGIPNPTAPIPDQPAQPNSHSAEPSRAEMRRPQRSRKASS